MRFYFIFICVLLALLTQKAWGQTLSPTKSYRLEKLEFVSSSTYKDHKDTEKLFPFKINQPITLNEIENTIQSLKNLEWIKAVTPHYRLLSNEALELKIEIEEYRIVRDFKVSGNYPFLSKQIKRLLTLQSGSVFLEEKLASSTLAIESFLNKYGYYNSEVSITPRLHKDLPVVDLKIKIKKGHHYRYNNIEVSGNAAIDKNRIINKISKSTRFQEIKLKKDLTKINKLYNKKGYIKSRVKVDEKTFDDSTNQVDLKLDVRENKKLVLTFSGPKAVKSNKLRDVVDLFNQHSLDRFVLEEGKSKLSEYYLSKGYPYVQIEPTLYKEGDLVYIDFNINAGTKVKLHQLDFLQNKKISDKKLAKLIQTQKSRFLSSGNYNHETLMGDKQTLEKHYREEGFLDAHLSDPLVTSNDLGDLVSVAFLVSEGEEYQIEDVEFYGLPQDSLLFTEKLPLRSHRPFNQKRFLQTQERILKNIFELGYAYATVEPRIEKNTEAGTVKVIYDIQPGPKTFVRQIIIKGDYKTKLSVIRQNLEFKENDLFNYQKLLNAQLNLRRLGVFSTVKASALGFENQNDKIDVLIEVQEDKPIVANIQVGYDNRNSLRGELNFRKRNLLGYAKEMHTRLIAGLTLNRIEQTFLAPRIFGADLNLANQYFVEYENAPIYNAYSYGSFISTLKTFGSRWTLGVKNQITRSELIESQSNVVALGNSVFDNTLNEFRVFAYYDARDNFSDPQKGIYLYANNEVNTELTNLSNNFNTVELGVNHHKKLLSRFTINQSFRMGQIFSLSSSSVVPFNELFFLGGSDTVRGFSEDGINASGGILRLIYNNELHFRVVEAFKLAAFVDAGVLDNSYSQISAEDIRESAGVGLRYFTPVGPIRLDYAFILDRKSNEPNGRLHFSFGYFF